MNQEKRTASFVTFYSFKGGVGRSMALINTAGILTGRGFRVLVMDLDLEAPGLSYLDPEAPTMSSRTTPKRPPQAGFIDLLCDAKERGAEADLFALSVSEIADRYTQAYKVPEDLGEFNDGSLRIMPAGKIDGDYSRRLDSLNLRGLYQDGLGEPLIRALKKRFAEAGLFDYVLVDSRTGFSDEAGICTRDLADYLMIFTGLNRQNIKGTSHFLKALRMATDGNKQFQIVLSPVPNGEDALVDEREAVAKNAFEDAWGSEVDLRLQIPYHPQLALTEEPHIFRRRRGHLFEAYRAVERSMLSALGHEAEIHLKRIKESLEQKDYETVLRDLQYMVRLEHGSYALSEFADYLATITLRRLRAKTGLKPKPEKLTLDQILRDNNGRRVVEFIINNIGSSAMLWGALALHKQLKGGFPGLAATLQENINNAYREFAPL